MTVLNVAPVITGPTGAASVNEGDGTHLYSFSFTDPGADTWTPSARPLGARRSPIIVKGRAGHARSRQDERVGPVPVTT